MWPNLYSNIGGQARAQLSQKKRGAYCSLFGPCWGNIGRVLVLQVSQYGHHASFTTSLSSARNRSQVSPRSWRFFCCERARASGAAARKITSYPSPFTEFRGILARARSQTKPSATQASLKSTVTLAVNKINTDKFATEQFNTTVTLSLSPFKILQK